MLGLTTTRKLKEAIGQRDALDALLTSAHNAIASQGVELRRYRQTPGFIRVSKREYDWLLHFPEEIAVELEDYYYYDGLERRRHPNGYRAAAGFVRAYAEEMIPKHVAPTPETPTTGPVVRSAGEWVHSARE
jgi:hypothetical protein